MNRRTTLAALAAACLAWGPALAPALAADPGITPTTIRVGAFAPLSGPAMSYGFDVLNAARMWYDKVNREGGVHGRKIELVVQDDRCNANDLVAAVKRLVEQDQVFMLNGGSCSAAVVAARDYVDRAKVPWLMLNASGDGALYPPSDWIWGAFSISQRAVGGSAVVFAARHLKAKRIGYVNHSDAYGAWNLEAAKVAAEKEGVELVVQSIDPAITDVTAPMLQLRAANVDAVLILTYARPAALIVRQANQFGMKTPIVLTASGTADLLQLAKNAGGAAALQNFYVQEVLADLPRSPSLKWIYDMYAAAYPDLAAKPDHPQVYMPYGLPSAMTLVRALQEAGPDPTREKVQAAMQNMKVDTGVMAGPIQFTPTDHAGQQSAIYLKYDGTNQTRVPGAFESPWRYKP